MASLPLFLSISLTHQEDIKLAPINDYYIWFYCSLEKIPKNGKEDI